MTDILRKNLKNSLSFISAIFTLINTWTQATKPLPLAIKLAMTDLSLNQITLKLIMEVNDPIICAE